MPHSARAALERLKAGNLRFQNNEPHVYQRVFEEFDVDAGRQDPIAAILTCSDSRVVCEMLFDTGIGDLFVARLAGNVASPEALGSLEYGVAVLGVSLVVVLGHENCGAVIAARSGQAFEGHLEELIAAIRPAAADCENLPDAIVANVRQSVAAIQATPWFAGLLAERKVRVVGATYELESGRVQFLE